MRAAPGFCRPFCRDCFPDSLPTPLPCRFRGPAGQCPGGLRAPARGHARAGAPPAVHPERFRQRQHAHAPCARFAGQHLRGRAPRAAQPGLPGEHRQRRHRGRAQVLPAAARRALRGTDARGLRARGAGRCAHLGLRQCAAGPLRDQEGEQLRLAGRGRPGLGVAAGVGHRRHPGQGGQRDDHRRAVLRPLLPAVRALCAPGAAGQRRPCPCPRHPGAGPGAGAAGHRQRRVPCPAASAQPLPLQEPEAEQRAAATALPPDAAMPPAAPVGQQ